MLGSISEAGAAAPFTTGEVHQIYDAEVPGEKGFDEIVGPLWPMGQQNRSFAFIEPGNSAVT